MTAAMIQMSDTSGIRQWCKEWYTIPVERRQIIQRHQMTAPVKISAICAEFDVSIKLAPLPARISGEIRPVPGQSGKFEIKINRFESANRQRFTAAHELAHYLVHEDQIGSGIVDSVLYRSNRSNFIEAQANRLAADLLMPVNLLELYLENFQPNMAIEAHVLNMAEYFGVSEMALRFRLRI